MDKVFRAFLLIAAGKHSKTAADQLEIAKGFEDWARKGDADFDPTEDFRERMRGRK